jgi:putative addiction module antidote
MMLELKLRRTGNSIGVVLPKEALAHLGVDEGDALFLIFLAEGALRLSAADPEFARKVQAAEEINRQYGNAIRQLTRR